MRWHKQYEHNRVQQQLSIKNIGVVVQRVIQVVMYVTCGDFSINRDYLVEK